MIKTAGKDDQGCQGNGFDKVGAGLLTHVMQKKSETKDCQANRAKKCILVINKAENIRQVSRNQLTAVTANLACKRAF